MDWLANSLWNWAVYRCTGTFYADAGEPAFDREQWDALRKGLDYTESAIPVAEHSDSFVAPFAIAILLEVLRYAGIILLVVALVIGVLRLLKVVKFKRPGKGPSPVDASQEGPALESPLDVLQEALRKAEAAGDFREATRLWFQIALKHMAAAKLVHPTPEKTNWEYVGEIEDHIVADDFALLTRVFEWVWFGESDQSEKAYLQYANGFRAFIQNVAR